MTDRELLQQALDALELTGVEYLTSQEIEHLDALEIALRARLAQPEPVNKFNPDWDELEACRECLREYMEEIKKLKKEWVGLTATEIKLLRRAANNDREFAELVQAKLKDKNT